MCRFNSFYQCGKEYNQWILYNSQQTGSTGCNQLPLNRIHNEAANRYQRAVGVVEKYQKKLPNGKYAKNAFISGFYTHFAYATQAHAIDLAAKEEENPSYENHELLIKRLQQSKQGFEKTIIVRLMMNTIMPAHYRCWHNMTIHLILRPFFER